VKFVNLFSNAKQKRAIESIESAESAESTEYQNQSFELISIQKIDSLNILTKQYKPMSHGADLNHPHIQQILSIISDKLLLTELESLNVKRADYKLS